MGCRLFRERAALGAAVGAGAQVVAADMAASHEPPAATFAQMQDDDDSERRQQDRHGDEAGAMPEFKL